MKEMRLTIECPACGGTGVYQGMGERDGAAVVCRQCSGTGAYEYHYTYRDFSGRKKKDGVTRVYLSGYGYVIAPREVVFERFGKIDMAKEGISYEEFLEGAMPAHIENLVCPMIADQGACHKIPGFVDECNRLDGGYLLGRYLSDCNFQPRNSECWARFKSQKADK